MNATSPKITIVMAVYNGAKFLTEQLDSLEEQTHKNWRLVVGDDRSTDKSLEVLRDFAFKIAGNGQGNQQCVDFVRGPAKGAAANFLHLLQNVADTSPNTDWIAFSDQDDVWLPDKLERAYSSLATADHEIPALYCGRTWITQEDLSKRRLSAAHPRRPGFRNALVQNIAAGNTILLNPAASRLVLRMALRTETVVIHDWWIYQLVTGAGGTVFHDENAHILYRQHAENEIGANDGLMARSRRLRLLARGEMRKWNRLNVEAMMRARSEFTPENRALLSAFATLPELSFAQCLTRLRSLGLYRQSTASTLVWWIAAVLRRA